MRKVLTLIFTIAVGTALMANPAINKKHAGKNNAGKAVNCNYCHTDAKVAKKKGTGITKANAKSNAKCAGAGCHS